MIDEGQLLKNLKDPVWRLSNLYMIMDKDGAEVLFRPNEVQAKFLLELWYRNIVAKARQRGFSTAVQILMLDTALFEDNIRAAVIAQDQTAASVIFRDKIKFAYNHLHPVILEMRPLIVDSATEIGFDNNSVISVSTSVRSGTLQFLHVSEFGRICARYPDKAREIVTGSLPAVAQNGIVVIESTAEGAEGSFHDMTKIAQAIQQRGKKLSKREYRLHFASWWDADEYETDPEDVIITSEDHAYFFGIEAEIGRPINERKRAWYVATRQNDFAGDKQKMFQEYPSTIKEAFEVSNEGVILHAQLTLARLQGRVTTVPYDPRVPVNTFWDLGLNDKMSIWFHQRVGLRDHWIKYLEGAGEPYDYFVKQMQETGWVWGKHYLPHDGNKRNPGATQIKTAADMLEELGLRDIEIVEKINDLWQQGIPQMRNAFASYWFDATECAVGLAHLDLYKKEWNDRMAVWKDKPRHDDHSNAADALRQHGQWQHTMKQEGGGGSNRPNRRNKGGMAA